MTDVKPEAKPSRDLFMGTFLLVLLAWRTGWIGYLYRWAYSSHRTIGRHETAHGRKRGGPRHVKRTPLLMQLGLRAPQGLLVDAAIAVAERVDDNRSFA